MPTPYSKVFSVFLSKIQDDSYSKMEQEDAEADMIDLLNLSVTNFEYPKVDIRNKDDESKEFAEDLSQDEVNILANLMVLEWLDRKIYNVRLLQQFVSNKDFKLTSQASHLQSLEKMREITEKTITTMKRKYSYRQTGQNYNKPDFRGLGGDDY